jgi:hypothetical protein
MCCENFLKFWWTLKFTNKNLQNLQRRDLFDIIFCLHDWYIHLQVWFPTGEKKRVWYLSQTSNEDIYSQFPTTKNLWQQLWRFLCNFNMPSNLCVWWNLCNHFGHVLQLPLNIYLSTQELFLLTSFGLITFTFSPSCSYTLRL